MIINPPNSSPLPLGEFLAKFSNYLVGITLICYVSGFAITNMYLGSLGIVNLDILRARYILAGILFLLFLSAIGYLIYGLIRTLRMNWHLPSANLIFRVIGYSAQNIAVLYFAIPAIAIFAGVKNPSALIPPRSFSLSWSVWFVTEPLMVVQRALSLYLVLLIAIVLIFGVLVAINPRDKHGTRKTRRRILADAFDGIKRERRGFFGTLGVGFAFSLATFLVPSLLYFITSNQIYAPSGNTTLLPEGWDRYFAAIVVIYTVVAMYLTCLFLMPPPSENGRDENPAAGTSAWIYLVTVAIIVMVPVYAVGIYPNLPQQIGGGKLLRVEATVSADELKPQFADPSVETFLVDRTANSTLFLLASKDNQKSRIIEVPSNLVQSILFNQSQ